MPDDFTPKIDPDLRAEMFRRVVDRARAAWNATKQRREDFQSFEEQVRGIPSSDTDGPWKNSCRLCDPLTQTESYTLRANLLQALNAHQIATCEPAQPGDEDAATQFEQWSNRAFFEAGGRRHLEDIISYAITRRVAISVVTWQQRLGTFRGYQYVAPDGSAVSEQERQPDVDYRREPIERDVLSEGLALRAPEPGSVFTDPANFHDLNRARAVCEWMTVTPEDLLRGIEEDGYDEEAVLSVLHGQPPAADADVDVVAGSGFGPDEHDPTLGTTVVDVVVGEAAQRTDEDAPIELLQIIGRVPLWWDGDDIALRHLADEDFLFVIHMASGTVLKWTSWQYARRGYIAWNIHRVPNSLDGVCLPEMLEAVQTELDATVRATLDAANIETTPATWAPVGHVQQFGYPEVKPGGVNEYDPNVGKPEPMVWDKQGILIDLNLAAALRALGKDISSAHFAQQPLPGDTTATEVNALYGGLNAKFDAYVNSLVGSVEELVFTMADVAGVNAPEAGLAVMVGKNEVRVNSDVLKKRYRITPFATSDQANPQLRLQKAMAKVQIQEKYITAVLKLLPMAPQFIGLVYHAAKQALMALGERSPEAYLGPEPPPAEIITGMQQQAQQQQALMMQAQTAVAGLQGMNGAGPPQPAMNGAQAGGAM